MNQDLFYTIIVYFSFFVVALFFSILINGLLIRFSRNLGMRSNTENLVRWNTQSKPSFGGISFFIIFLLSIAALAFFFEQNLFFHNIKLVGVLIAVTLGFLMGLFDDAFNTKVFIKLFAQITCAVILIATGTYITLFPNEILNYIFTVLWVVGIMNSINMLDNMDGITTSVSFFILSTILVQNLIVTNVNDYFNILIIGMLSALSGFLLYNWPPSRMFMGDTGSQFLGVMLAAVSIIFLWNYKEPAGEEIAARQITSVLVVFTMPLVDTITVSIKRIFKGRSPFVGGKDHTTHHLTYIGLSEKMVALVFAMLSFVSMALGLVVLNVKEWSHWLTVGFSVYFIVIFTVLFVIANKNQR